VPEANQDQGDPDLHALFERPGFVWVSGDIGKAGKERWIPVSEELATVVDRIRLEVASDEYALPAQRWRDPRSTARKPTTSDARVRLRR
jgi:hypothetical protein